MNTKHLIEIIGLTEGEDFEYIPAKDFENIIAARFEELGAEVKREVLVPERGDGRRGRIDLVVALDSTVIPIEIDRKTPRVKSIFKVRSVSTDNAFIITRSPFSVVKV